MRTQGVLTISLIIIVNNWDWMGAQVPWLLATRPFQNPRGPPMSAIHLCWEHNVSGSSQHYENLHSTFSVPCDLRHFKSPACKTKYWKTKQFHFPWLTFKSEDGARTVQPWLLNTLTFSLKMQEPACEQEVLDACHGWKSASGGPVFPWRGRTSVKRGHDATPALHSH